MDIKKLIEEFINEISVEYPKLIIGYNYYDDIDEYDIWHTNQSLEFDDEKFKPYVAKKAKKFLFSNGIYNFSFGYDHYKFKEFGDNFIYYTVSDYNIADIKFAEIETKFDEKYLYAYNFNTSNNISDINLQGTSDFIDDDYELANTFDSLSNLICSDYRLKVVA